MNFMTAKRSLPTREMLYVFLSGLFGFFGFRCLSNRSTYEKKGIVFLTFSSGLGVSVLR